MNIAYGIIFLGLTLVIAYAVYLWWTETECRDKEKEQEMLKMKNDIEVLRKRTKDLEDKQGMMERNIMKVYRVMDPLGRNMYYEK